MDKEIMKGSIDILVLSLLTKKNMYGYELAKSIKKESDDLYNMGEGTLYPALKRLEAKGYSPTGKTQKQVKGEGTMQLRKKEKKFSKRN